MGIMSQIEEEHEKEVDKLQNHIKIVESDNAELVECLKEIKLSLEFYIEDYGNTGEDAVDMKQDMNSDIFDIESLLNKHIKPSKGE